MQHAGRGLDLLAATLVERTGTADPVEVLNVFRNRVFDDGHFEVQRAEPLGALRVSKTPRVTLVLDVAEQQTGFTREARLHHDFVTTHVNDRVYVLDVDGALFGASTTRGAGPQHVRVDD